MNNEILEKLKKRLERKYGNLDNESGCYVNGRWLSVATIVEIIDNLDEEN